MVAIPLPTDSPLQITLGLCRECIFQLKPRLQKNSGDALTLVRAIMRISMLHRERRSGRGPDTASALTPQKYERRSGSASAALRGGARSACCAAAHSGLSWEWLIGLGSRRIVINDLIWSALIWRSKDPVFFHPGDQGGALHSQPCGRAIWSADNPTRDFQCLQDQSALGLPQSRPLRKHNNRGGARWAQRIRKRAFIR